MTNHDELLDQYIDALNAGRRPDVQTDDAELADLFRIADLVHALTEPEWPPASFVNDLAARLSSDLTVKSNGHAVIPTGDSQPEMLASNPRVADKTGDTRLEPFPPRQTRLRQSLQIAGALAAFAVFAMVLTMVFRDGDSSSVIPAVAPPEDKPSQIAFAGANAENVDIFVINSDGTGLTNLTNSAGINWMPAWSPDGSQIAFVRSAGTGNELSQQLFVMDADGSNVRQITQGPDQFTIPVWSPDGSTIAVIKSETTDSGAMLPSLILINPDGSNLRMLTNGEIPGGTPVWSPDGSELAVPIELSGRGSQVLLYPADDGDPRSLDVSYALTSNVFQHAPAWSPIGNKIAFEQRSNALSDPTDDVTTVGIVDGAAFRMLSSSRNDVFREPAWSPDGLMLVVSGKAQLDADGLYVADVDSNNSPRYIDNTSATDHHATWGPDAKHIAFIRGAPGVSGAQELMVINSDGTGLLKLADGLVSPWAPAWRPGTLQDQDTTQQTAEAEASPTPQSDLEPDPSVNPPTLLVQHAESFVEAVTGSFNWISLEEAIVVSATSPFIDVGEDGLTAVPGSDLRLVFPDGTTSPDEVIVSLYTWRENSAIPVGSDGSVAEQLWFAPTTEPVSQQPLAADDLTFILPETPDRYVVQVQVRWPDVVDDRAPEPLKVSATYAITVHVSDEVAQPDAASAEVIDIVREFLMDPDAELEVRQLQDSRYEALRHPDGIDSPDRFVVDVDPGYVAAANFAGRTSLYMPSDPIDEDMALAVAEHHLWMWAPGFEEMRLHQSDVLQFGGAGNDDPILHTSWAAHDEATGAWLPPRAWIQVNMETGQIVSFHQIVATFEHSTVPTITAEQAQAIALDEAAATQGDDVTYVVENVELHGYENAYPISGNLVWQVHVTPRATLYMVDAHTGEIATFDYSGAKDLMPDIDTVDEPTTIERDADELISKGDVVDILQDAFDIPTDGINLTLDETPDGRWLYSVNRIGDDVIDSFMVDARTGTILNANFVSHQPAYNIGTPIDEDTARQMATDFASALAPRFADMTLFNESSVDVAHVADSSAEGTNYTASWSVRDPESGAWMPPSIYIVISLDSGQLLSANQLIHEYDGPTAFVVTEDEAVELAREIAGEIYPAAITGNLENVELFGFVTLAGSRGAGEPVETTHRLVWRVYIEGVPMTPIDAITGEVAR